MRTDHGANDSRDGFSLISNEKLIALYAAMVQYRMIGERLRAADGGAGGGHEAAVVGATIDLRKDDSVHGAEREWRSRLIQCATLEELKAQAGEAADAGDAAGSLAEAGEKALEHKSQKKGAIAVALLGKERVPAGAWKKALREAGKKKLPALFVCLHGPEGEGGRGKRRARGEALTDLAQSSGFPGIVVDGNDVVAVYRVASEAIAHARKGNGPTLIDCQSWRLEGGISKTGDCLADPILNMERYLDAKGLFRAELRSRIRAEFEKSVNSGLGRVG